MEKGHTKRNKKGEVEILSRTSKRTGTLGRKEAYERYINMINRKLITSVFYFEVLYESREC